MIPRSERLRRSEDVLTVIRKGRKVATPYVLVYVRKSHQARLACVVGKKVSKSAVRRHRIQRWMREIARGIMPDMETSCDMVWVALPATSGIKTQEELKQSISPYVKKITSCY